MREHACVAEQATSETADLDWGRLNWLITDDSMPGTEMTFGVVTIKPGERNPLHSHPNCEEILYIVSGQCEHKLGDDMVLLEPGSAIRIPRGIKHWARCTSSEPLVAVIAFSSGQRQAENHESDSAA